MFMTGLKPIDFFYDLQIFKLRIEALSKLREF